MARSHMNAPCIAMSIAQPEIRMITNRQRHRLRGQILNFGAHFETVAVQTIGHLDRVCEWKLSHQFRVTPELETARHPGSVVVGTHSRDLPRIRVGEQSMDRM